MNISLGGLYLLLNEQIAVSKDQVIYVGLVSGPAILELQGRIREIRQAAGQDEARSHQTGLAVEFQIFETPDELVLASLIDELRARSISITVTASLAPEGSKDLRFQAESVTHNDWAPVAQALRGTLELSESSGTLPNSSDYWRLLDHIHRLVGSLGQDEQILDAGCGNGAFAAFLLIQDAYRLRISSGRAISKTRYVGVDFPAFARQSRSTLDVVAAELQASMHATASSAPVSKTSFCSADLNRPLPFRNDQFDRIVCNLLMGYLQNPLTFVRELMRVLAPTGLLVLTSPNPRAEIPISFTHPVQQTWDAADPSERLWGSLIHLRQAEREGIPRTPDKQELTELITSGGAVQPLIYSALADQAYIILAGKHGRPA